MLFQIIAFYVVCGLGCCSYHCPTSCICNVYAISATADGFTVDCTGRNDTDVHTLFADIEALLNNMTDDGLKVLTISNTILTDLPRSVCRMTSLTHLYISYNRLRKLPDKCFINMKHLLSFQASYNQITVLQDGLFDGLQQLREICLDNNQISSIGLGLFSNVSDLNSLNRIIMNHNRLTVMEPWMLIRGLAISEGAPVVLDLGDNSISTGKKTIKWKFSCGMKIYIAIDLYNNNISHFTDLLKPLGIKSVEYVCLRNFAQQSDGKAGSQTHIVSIRRNPVVCDCVDFEMYQFDARWQVPHMFTNVYCVLPVRLTGLEIPRIPLTEFVCDVVDQCPAGCQCFHRPVDASMNVNCTSANMTSLPEQLPVRPKSNTKYNLFFSNNKFLSALESRNYFENAYEFDASRSALENIDLAVWTSITGIPNVSLRANLLKYLPESVVDVNISSYNIDIGGNPWHCSCENHWMTAWLKSIEKKLKNPGDIHCATPARLLGKNLLTMTDSEYCYVPPKDTRPIIIALSTIAGFVVFVIIFYIVVYQMRWKLFSRFKFHPFDRDECDGEEMDYDVFLCCSSEDHAQHGLKILEQLESQNYKACYHLRDFVGGIEILENIIAAVQRSKRTVCLVTENFLHSAYCMHEFMVAVNLHMTTGHSGRLIILMALDFPNNIAEDETNAEGNMVVLRQHLRRYTYIDYRKDDWLARLCYALPIKTLNDGVNGLGAQYAADDDEQLLI